MEQWQRLGTVSVTAPASDTRKAPVFLCTNDRKSTRHRDSGLEAAETGESDAQEGIGSARDRTVSGAYHLIAARYAQ